LLLGTICQNNIGLGRLYQDAFTVGGTASYKDYNSKLITQEKSIGISISSIEMSSALTNMHPKKEFIALLELSENFCSI
jgi:hypothetical protein